MDSKSRMEAKKIVTSVLDELLPGAYFTPKETIRRIKERNPDLSESLIMEILKEIQDERKGRK